MLGSWLVSGGTQTLPCLLKSRAAQLVGLPGSIRHGSGLQISCIRTTATIECGLRRHIRSASTLTSSFGRRKQAACLASTAVVSSPCMQLRHSAGILTPLRTFKHLAEASDASPTAKTPSTTPPPSSKPPPPPPPKTPQLEDGPPPSVAQQRRTDWTIIKRLMVNVWPKNDWKTRGIVLFGFALLVLAKVLNVQVPQIFKTIIDSLNVEITDPSALWLLAGSLILGYGAARIGATLSSELLNALFANISQRAIRRVALSTFSHLLNLDLRFHLARQTGGLTRAIDRGTKGISFLLQAILFRIAPTALEIGMVCGILTYKFGWDFAAVTVLALAAYTWFTVRTTSWRTQFRRDANQADNKAASVAVDSLINFEAVKHFNNERYEVAQYDKHLQDYEKYSTKIATSLAFLNSGQNVIFSSALTAAMFLAARGVVEGTMTLGDVVMVNQLIFQLSLPLNFLGTIYREMRQNLLDMEILLKLVEENKPVQDIPNAPPLLLAPPSSSSSAISQAQVSRSGTIRFENVTFSYHPSRPIFSNLSFTIPGGSKVAIVGPSGCGKSTVFRLLYRFYDPETGRITIDNQDITRVQISSLRSQIGVVPQDTPLFHRDILHNIAYGSPDVNATEAQVVEAAKKANVHESIMRLPDGYRTKVGERGLMISGGEKQRLAIARVMLKDPPILFFDEATSALDAATEAGLMKNIDEVLVEAGSGSGGGEGRRRTSVFVAHRLRTVVGCDLIVVLGHPESGAQRQGQGARVVEQGTHEELMRLRGVYWGMWQQQVANELEEDEDES